MHLFMLKLSFTTGGRMKKKKKKKLATVFTNSIGNPMHGAGV